MRIAVISDIHSNLEAAEAVFKDIIDEQNVDRVVCLGDTIGYGADPEACLDLVIENCDHVLGGNHEYGVLDEDFWFEIFKHPANKAVRWTAQRLNSLQGGRYTEFLARLDPHHQDREDVLYVHASPRDPVTEYFSKGDVEKFLKEYARKEKGEEKQGVKKKQTQESEEETAEDKLDINFGLFEKLCFSGHNHIPGILIKPNNPYRHLIIIGASEPITLDKPYNAVLPKDLRQGIYELRDDEKIIVNVGAVGQPRNGDPRASYFIYDVETIRCVRVSYDYETAARKILDAGLPKFLATRLKKGE